MGGGGGRGMLFFSQYVNIVLARTVRSIYTAVTSRYWPDTPVPHNCSCLQLSAAARAFLLKRRHSYIIPEVFLRRSLRISNEGFNMPAMLEGLRLSSFDGFGGGLPV